jgi:small subunit ribosomal protein S10
MLLQKKEKILKISFKFKTFHNYNFELILPKILEKIKSLEIKNSNLVSLPLKIQRFTVLRSPHVDKKSREQFELRMYSKFINVFFNLNNPIDKQKAKLLINYIKHSSNGLSLKITFKI